MQSRFPDLAHRLAAQYLCENKAIHMSLTKTLLRLSAVLKDREFFIQICNSTIPHLSDPDGELSGTFIRSLFCLCGHDEGMQYFLQCSPKSKRYQYIVPEMLYGPASFPRLMCRLV